MLKEEDIRLIRYMLGKGTLDKQRAEKLQRLMGGPESKKCDDVLIDQIGVTDEIVAASISEEFKIPLIRLTESIISLSDRQLQDDFLKKYSALPIIRSGIELTVVFTLPPYKETLEAMRRDTKAFVVPVVTRRSDLETVLHKEAEKNLDEYKKLQSKFQLDTLDLASRPRDKVLELLNSPRMPNADVLIDEIMMTAIKSGATEIYLEPRPTEFRVRINIDGVIQTIVTLPKELIEPLANVMRTRGSLKLFDRKKAQDGRYTTQYGTFSFDLRVNTLPTIEGERFSITIRPKGSTLRSLEEIGFSMENYDRVKYVLNRPRGLVLITGPSGCGKSTTAYSCLASLGSSEKNIVTVENPVEYRLDFAGQVEIDPEQNMDYASAMRAVLRQHPDIIFLGDIRDSAAGRSGAEAAMTGAMVLSTVLASDSFSVIPRLVNFDIPPAWLASILNGVIYQQLVRCVCPHCKESYKPASSMLQSAGLHQLDGSIVLFRGRGCEACGGDGHLGRTTIHEVLVIDEDLRDLIYNQASLVKVKERAVAKGFTSIRFDAAKKLMSGTISLEEYMRVLG